MAFSIDAWLLSCASTSTNPIIFEDDAWREVDILMP